MSIKVILFHTFFDLYLICFQETSQGGCFRLKIENIEHLTIYPAKNPTWKNSIYIKIMMTSEIKELDVSPSEIITLVLKVSDLTGTFLPELIAGKKSCTIYVDSMTTTKNQATGKIEKKIEGVNIGI